MPQIKVEDIVNHKRELQKDKFMVTIIEGEQFMRFVAEKSDLRNMIEVIDNKIYH